MTFKLISYQFRSGKELEGPKKNSNEEKQYENRKEETMEAKNKEGEAKVNNKGEKRKFDQVVIGRKKISRQPSHIRFTLTFPSKIHKNQDGCSVYNVLDHIQDT